MLATILVATPHPAFGELLRISLIDSGQYQVDLVRSASEARASANRNTYHLAILDAALQDEPFIPLCMHVLDKQPGVRLVVIPPDNNPNHPALGGLIPHGYLSRPFYLPDLIETVSRLLAHREKQSQAPAQASVEAAPGDYPSSAVPPWLQEPFMLRAGLQREMAATQAIASIAGSGSSIRAFIGDLNDEAAQELVEVVFRHWNRAEKTDLMRFVRLNADKKDYLVYATHIIEELALILVFDTAAPLSQIRPQTKAMAHALATTPPAEFGAYQPAGPHAAPVNPPHDQPDTQPAVDFPINVPPVSLTPDSAAMPGQTEAETEPLNDGFFFGRVNNSFAERGAPTSGKDYPMRENGAPKQPASAPEPAETNALPDASELFNTVDQNEEGDSVESSVINLTALLGSVPSPDPDRGEPHKPVFNTDWFLDRSASSPIPTLAGGLNSSPSDALPPALPVWDLSDSQNAFGASNGEQAKSPSTSQDEDAKAREREALPQKKAARTAPLDPQTIPLDSLPSDPALPKDYAPTAYEPPINIKDSDFFQAVSGRPASLEVKTEPPVTPPGVQSVMETHLPTLPPDPSLSTENEQLPVPIEDTHPNVVSTISSLGQLEPASPALSLLNYTCVLVPRLPQHYLTGELADRMAGWVQQLCLAFGWRLEGISIRPEYLQWTVQVAPAISPGNLVRIVRQRTSLHVFGNYPHLAEQNPSGDFWANGYLIVSGAQPPSAQLLRDYIAQTRKRQGANK